MGLKVQENYKGQQQGELPQPSDGCSSSSQTRVFNWLPLFAALFLTVNAADSAYRMRHDLPALAFVVFAYSNLMLLLICLRKLDKLGRDKDCPPERRAKLKAAVWALATGLNLAFAWRVAALMPPVVAAMVWLLSGTVTAGGFYGLFIYRNSEGLSKNSQLAPAEKV